jgi:hypothetical protein
LVAGTDPLGLLVVDDAVVSLVFVFVVDDVVVG